MPAVQQTEEILIVELRQRAMALALLSSSLKVPDKTWELDGTPFYDN